ncbi:prephenate dehydrogenase [Bacillus circulans]|uniref:prephenate dehydrogenase n=1 Tax=Niallia circulans TaxID=1397 RepID=UPI00155FFDE5|nr:prephenate dehydrogenase [Niallia circulans]NRG29062.1 prephenate dehydrogenase [Niallia circulans]UQZ77089.1 prephenate dehydrogenase [Niallia circulans]
MNGRVFIIGLGLIGGSLALCIKKEHPESIITGFDISEDNLKLASMMGVIDNLSTTIKEGAKTADLIILSTPVKETEKIIEILSKIELKENVIITDVGSTKSVITEKSQVLLDKNVTFIGGHPMAGSHKSGVSASKVLLFENAFYLLTPHEKIKDQHVQCLLKWLQGTNAKFLVISPEEHDLLAGAISHMPHIVAASLVHQADQISEKHKLVTRLAAGGFRDITRIASSSPSMWRDILIHNKNVLIELMNEWKKEMDRVLTLIENERAEELYDYFSRAKKVRDGLPQDQKGAIPAFYDLFVDVPDYPGVISEITGYLAQEKISITNIRIMETREEIFGILAISFQTEEDRIRAQKCIATYSNYDTTIG